MLYRWNFFLLLLYKKTCSSALVGQVDMRYSCADFLQTFLSEMMKVFHENSFQRFWCKNFFPRQMGRKFNLAQDMRLTEMTESDIYVKGSSQLRSFGGGDVSLTCPCVFVVASPVSAGGQWVAEESAAGVPSLLPGARADRHGHEPGCRWCLCQVW